MANSYVNVFLHLAFDLRQLTLTFCLKGKGKRKAGEISDVTEKASACNVSHIVHVMVNDFSHLMANIHRTRPWMKS